MHLLQIQLNWLIRHPPLKQIIQVKTTNTFIENLKMRHYHHNQLEKAVNPIFHTPLLE